jgi:hypothetical protein
VQKEAAQAYRPCAFFLLFIQVGWVVAFDHFPGVGVMSSAMIGWALSSVRYAVIATVASGSSASDFADKYHLWSPLIVLCLISARRILDKAVDLLYGFLGHLDNQHSNYKRKRLENKHRRELAVGGEAVATPSRGDRARAAGSTSEIRPPTKPMTDGQFRVPPRRRTRNSSSARPPSRKYSQTPDLFS